MLRGLKEDTLLRVLCATRQLRASPVLGLSARGGWQPGRGRSDARIGLTHILYDDRR